jgi:acyl-homoserine lactone acylase PvdQ
MKYEHVPFSKTPLKPFFERQMPQAGTRRTPNVAIFFYHKGNYRPLAGPIIRMIADMSDDKNILAVLDTGTEMRAFSPYIDDQMQLFHSGKYVTMPTPFNTDKWPSAHNQDNLPPVIDINKTASLEHKQQ